MISYKQEKVIRRLLRDVVKQALQYGLAWKQIRYLAFDEMIKEIFKTAPNMQSAARMLGVSRQWLYRKYNNMTKEQLKSFSEEDRRQW